MLPLPNCFSMDRSASSIALSFSLIMSSPCGWACADIGCRSTEVGDDTAERRRWGNVNQHACRLTTELSARKSGVAAGVRHANGWRTPVARHFVGPNARVDEGAASAGGFATSAGADPQFVRVFSCAAAARDLNQRRVMPEAPAPSSVNRSSGSAGRAATRGASGRSAPSADAPAGLGSTAVAPAPASTHSGGAAGLQNEEQQALTESSSSTALAGCLCGLESHPVHVEARMVAGIPGMEIVGLPERGVREAQVRVRSALTAMGLDLPRRKFVLNLAPGDLRKTGSAYDLAIAVALLGAAGRAQTAGMARTLILGELALDGSLRPVRGVLAQLRSAHARGVQSAIVPRANGAEAALMRKEMDVRVAVDLRAVLDHIDEREPLPLPAPGSAAQIPAHPDLSDVKGQPGARRALEIAAAGEHHLLMLGSPGAGKTMLARRLPSLLPPPSPSEALAIATIASVHGNGLPASLEHAHRPFRAPHHTASAAAMIGGGDPLRPGEVTLSHRGVLFLDELPEFRRDVIETLRTTMEIGEVQIARAHYRARLPAAPLVVAAMNPCPCGYAGDPERVCTCSPERVARYRHRISGPLIDRFDLHVSVPRVVARDLMSRDRGESTERVAARVLQARQRKHAREKAASPDVQGRQQNKLGAPDAELDRLLAQTDGAALNHLDQAVEALGLSARGFIKALRIARTIADLAEEDRIGITHVAEAVQYRLLDRRPTR